MTKKLGKFEITQADNGFILGMINTEYVPGGNGNQRQQYYTKTYVAKDAQELADMLVTHLVTERLVTE